MIINYVKPSMIFGPLVEKQYVKHIRIQWRAQASGGGGGGGGGGGHDSLSCWFFYFEAVWASQPN